jgi:hypothetical protein
MTVAEEVKHELRELEQLDVPVPENASEYVDAHTSDIEDLRRGGMRISEIADYVIECAGMERRAARRLAA